MSKKLYITALSIAAFLPAFGQYDQSIAVEGKYVPEYIQHDRIGIFPRPVKFSLDKSSLNYSLLGVNADFTPQAIPIQATGWRSSRNISASRGYVDIALGSFLESNLSAGYRIIDSKSSALGVRLQHNSTSLWKPNLAEVTKDTRMERYDESLGIYGHHNFEGKGRLDAALDWHIGNFNYYGFSPIALKNVSPEVDAENIDAPTQTLNDIIARVAWYSPTSLDNVSWNIGAAARYFGYRRLYAPSTDERLLDSFSGARETDVNINAGFLFPTSTKSAIGVDLNADLLSYADYKTRGENADNLVAPEAPDTYGMISLTPFYRFSRSKLNIRIGAQIDLAFNAGTELKRYSTFHIAPDVKIDYNAGPVALYVHALGGSELHTLAASYEQDYYQTPAIYNTSPVYTPLDARAGIGFGQFNGFSAGFEVAYRTSRNQYFGGWYTQYLNQADKYPAEIGLPSTIDNRAIAYDFDPSSRANISGFSFALKAGYDAGRYFAINAEGRYQNQNGKTGYYNGYDRPEWTAIVNIESNPWSSLKLHLGYNLRAMRMMPVKAHYADTTPLNSDLIVMHRLPNTSMLNFAASYGITENLNVRIQADNLLCRKVTAMPGLLEPGIRLSAGLDFTF